MNGILASLLLALAAVTDPSVGKTQSNLRVMPVARTPESETVMVSIAIPRDGQLLTKDSVWVQARVDGFAIGSDSSQFDRSNELPLSSFGQTLHVIVDNQPYFIVEESSALDPFRQGGYYYDFSYKFKIPFRLKNGAHVIRMFPARSFGESLKGENCFRAITFYMGEEEPSQVDLSLPFITYNEPSNTMRLVEGKPVLLDFYVTNTELSPDGYKVRLSIDGQVNRNLNSWQPYYIYGLKRGEHTIRLELLNESNQLVPGLFNDILRTITVY